MELMLTIALAALIIGITVPTFIGINRGASARQANNLVYAHLKQAQQKAAVTRQRVGFYVVTQLIDANNPWVSANMVNRSYFLYASDTPGVAKAESFITSIQTLPAPMMFDFSGSATASDTTIPTVTLVNPTTGAQYFKVRGFRFAPAGGLHPEDLDAASGSSYKFKIVIAEGLAAAGGTYSLKTGNVIRYTNIVNGFTGRVTSQ